METTTASKGLKRTISEGLASESGRCNKRSNKFGVFTQRGIKHRESGVENMGIPDIKCMSRCKGWMDDGAIRDSSSDKEPVGRVRGHCYIGECTPQGVNKSLGKLLLRLHHLLGLYGAGS